jgi:[protein-PII] uridylyltransferase
LTTLALNNDFDNIPVLLQEKRQQLIASFLKGEETNFLNSYAGIIDWYFREVFNSSKVGPRIQINKNPYAIIALGGYGRQEQCMQSDIDLLILFDREIPPETDILLQEIVYPLWDAGFDVGYATRSLNESVKMARADYDILTPLLDARFICGMSNLYIQLTQRLRRKVISKHAPKIIDWLVSRSRERHLRFGDSAYLLEPNLKEGQGGLRDYHAMLWIAKLKLELKESRDLEYFGWLSHDEYTELMGSLEFIWKVRNHLHHITGRKYDQLHFENQVKLSEYLNYTTLNGRQGVELFLEKLHTSMETIKQQHLIFLYEQGYDLNRRRIRKGSKHSYITGLKVANGLIDFSSPTDLIKNPILMVRIFEESARLKIPLSVEAKRIIREFAHLVDGEFRKSAEVLGSFERVLAAPAPRFNVINDMLNTGFLVNYLPELKPVINSIQYDEYHLYPVGKHLLRTVRILKEFGNGADKTNDGLRAKLWKELKNKRLLLWAALLHDIGKGKQSKGHSRRGAEIAEKILMEKGMRPKDVATVSFLIMHHLLLVETATRRDIHDEETAIVCARIIKDPERLKMLYLLTVADSMATGPKAWNSWTGTLLSDFFLKVLNVIEKGELATREAVSAVEDKKQLVLDRGGREHDGKDVAALLRIMSPRYLLYRGADEIVDDISLYKGLGGNRFVWEITATDNALTRNVKICAHDHPGLFSKIAGMFTLNHINILSAQVFTWREKIALDVFEVTAPADAIFESEKWEKARKTLDAALNGELDIASALTQRKQMLKSSQKELKSRPDKVIVDNQSSSFFTIIEVYTYDYPGLLFDITDALFRCGLDIWVAKIATKVDQVVDVFYVRDFDGEKVDSKEQEIEIQKSISDILP